MNLEHIPDAVLSKRSKLSIHAIDFAFKSAIDRYARLEGILLEYPPVSDGTNAISMGWDMLDWCEKTRKLIEVGSGFKKKAEWCQTFIRKIRPIENVRSFIQHLDKELSLCTKESLPLLGLLSASVQFPKERGYCILVALPDGHKHEHTQEKDQVLCFDTQEPFSPPIDHIRMMIGQYRLDLTRMNAIMTEGRKCFLKAIQEIDSPNNGVVLTGAPLRGSPAAHP